MLTIPHARYATSQTRTPPFRGIILIHRSRNYRALIAAASLLLACLHGCAASDLPLAEYARHNLTPRQNLPGSYIDYLKTTRFTHHELDNLPPYAVLFYGDPQKYLAQLNLTPGEITSIDLGTTDASLLYIVRPTRGAPFMVNRGQAGAGGIATQTAELIALGARYVVHIGTAGLLGPTVPDPRLILSQGSYKDGAAVMLSHDNARISTPDPTLTARFDAALTQAKIPFAPAHGYTIPIYYFQPEGLIQDLLAGPAFARPRPAYIEMEEASFFETARHMQAQAASLVTGADRYTIENGHLTHTFLDDTTVTRSLTDALRATRTVFDQLHASRSG